MELFYLQRKSDVAHRTVDHDRWEVTVKYNIPRFPVTLDETYFAGFPIVVLVDGSLHSAVVALVMTSAGVWFIDDGWFDSMPSRPANHFAEGQISGSGPWQCGGRHVFVSPAKDAPENGAWRVLEELAGDRLLDARVRAEKRLMELMR